jgi:lysophospholipase L1-like esterase
VTNIKEIVKHIQKKSLDTELYLESILPVNNDIGMFEDHANKTQEVLTINKVLERMAGEFGIIYIDLHSLFATKDNKLNPEYSNDGLHLNGQGYMLWKSAVEKHVK